MTTGRVPERLNIQVGDDKTIGAAGNQHRAGKERDKTAAWEHDDSYSKCYTDVCREDEPKAAFVEAKGGKAPIKSKERKGTT